MLEVNVKDVMHERLFEVDEYIFEMPTHSRTTKIGTIKVCHFRTLTFIQ